VNTILLPADHPDAIPTALDFLHRGELVAFPTDTVYGLGADLHNPQAIEGLYIAKGREASKAIAVLVGSPSDLASVAGELPESAQRLAQRFWPGPLTLVVPRHPDLPANLSGSSGSTHPHLPPPLPTVGVRMPAHPFALALLQAAGPLAVTSANLSGAASPVTADEVHAQLNGRIAFIIDGGATPGGIPSTVVDCTSPEPHILREGPVSAQDIQQVINQIVG
jgi:L-threonylcarbamoyladenylate synthase